MPGLVPGIHVLAEFCHRQDVDGRDEPGHDGEAGAPLGLAKRRNPALGFWPKSREGSFA
jgi:hypothetical protein